MRSIVVAALLSIAFTSSAAAAADCEFAQREPIRNPGGLLTLFMDPCGVRYEAGYRLEGNTLHFPLGGAHTISQASEAQAEAVLRETYGLVGERDALVRTRW